MATIKANSKKGDSVNLLTLDFSTLLEGDDYSGTSKKFVITYEGQGKVTVKGTGFHYDASGIPDGGTVKSVTSTLDGFSYSIEGLKLKAAEIADAAFTDGKDDDFAILEKALKGDDKLTGAAGSDGLYGGAGKDSLKGEGGSDVLVGGLGNDKLTGGKGHDFFVFIDTLGKTGGKSNIDTMTDFKHGDDTIGLGVEIFTEVASGVTADNFQDVSKHKEEDDDRILYSSKKGYLYYDHDGKGGDDPIKFAALDHKPHLTAEDFTIIPSL